MVPYFLIDLELGRRIRITHDIIIDRIDNLILQSLHTEEIITALALFLRPIIDTRRRLALRCGEIPCMLHRIC